MLLWTLDHLLSLVELTAERGMHSAAVKGNVGPAAASAPARPACRKTRRGARRWRVADGGGPPPDYSPAMRQAGSAVPVGAPRQGPRSGAAPQAARAVSARNGISASRARLSFTAQSATARDIHSGTTGPAPSRGSASFAHDTSLPGSTKASHDEN